MEILFKNRMREDVGNDCRFFVGGTNFCIAMGLRNEVDFCIIKQVMVKFIFSLSDKKITYTSMVRYVPQIER